MRSRPYSEDLYRASCELMPGGVNSPVRAFMALNMTPLIVSQGKRDTITDVDGHSYIDFCQSWGALILGHAPDPVVAKVIEQLHKGSSFGIATPYEKELAQKIRNHLPSIEKLRFVSSGTEATMSAIRAARGFTGKERIIKFDGHFHGHSDSLLIQAGSGVTQLPHASSKGIPVPLMQLTSSLPFNDIDTCRAYIQRQDDIAAILLEPISGNMGVVPARKEFLKMLREETAKKGIILIFDEVITGFRVGLHGAQGLYEIQPDMTCLGKVIGGGFPVAAFGGKKEIMDQIAPLGGVYHGGTLSGNPLAMCAGLETLSTIERPNFFKALQEKTDAFLTPLCAKIAEKNLPICIQSVGSMFSFFFGVKKVESREDLASLDEKAFKQFFHFLFNQGIYLSPYAYEANFLSSAHTEENLAYTKRAILEYFEKDCIR